MYTPSSAGPCGHEFCWHCWFGWLDGCSKNTCPLCRLKVPAAPPQICRTLARIVEAAHGPAVQERRQKMGEEIARLRAKAQQQSATAARAEELAQAANVFLPLRHWYPRRSRVYRRHDESEPVGVSPPQGTDAVPGHVEGGRLVGVGRRETAAWMEAAAASLTRVVRTPPPQGLPHHTVRPAITPPRPSASEAIAAYAGISAPRSYDFTLDWGVDPWMPSGDMWGNAAEANTAPIADSHPQAAGPLGELTVETLRAWREGCPALVADAVPPSSELEEMRRRSQPRRLPGDPSLPCDDATLATRRVLRRMQMRGGVTEADVDAQRRTPEGDALRLPSRRRLLVSDEPSRTPAPTEPLRNLRRRPEFQRSQPQDTE